MAAEEIDEPGLTLADDGREPGESPPTLAESPESGADAHAPTEPGTPACITTAASRSGPSSMSRRPPAVEGYEILGELGRGGMGVVYHARRVLLNRPCALKMILAGAYADHVAAIRFLAEAEAVARLTHPNVVQIHAIGEAEGLPYFELEYVEGGSLDKALDGTPWHPRRASTLVEGLARGVAEAHRLGIVHRDLKPANILLTAEGSPKITDFGLAKAIGAETGLTKTEAVMGSPNYMAPEQAQGDNRKVGPAADVYAIGAIYYELLTGRSPFKASSVMETLRQVREAEPVPPGRLVPGLPRDAETIALRCLEKDPARRYASAADLAEDLRRFLAGEPIAARQPLAIERAWRWCRRNPSLAALSAASAALLVALTVGSVAAAVILRGQRNDLLEGQAREARAERARKLALVDAALSSAPDGVAFFIAELKSVPELATTALRRRFDDPSASPLKRLRAAELLATLGDADPGFLVGAVSIVPDPEARNYIQALEASGRPAVDGLRRRFQAAEDVAEKARLAAALLSLGEPDPGRSMLARRPDPVERVRFVTDFARWHGGLGPIASLIDSVEDRDFRSGICMALAEIPPDDLTEAERLSLTAPLLALHRDAPDAATHSASGLALARWGVEPEPPLASKAPELGRDWFVNGEGMTMLRLPVGAVLVQGGVPKTAVATVTGELFVADREVSAGLFRRFLGDKALRPADRPNPPPAPDREVSPTDDSPMDNVSWVDAMLFCNWLSRREGRVPCYERDASAPSGWAMRLDADGYRLPYNHEWEHAAWAGASTRFPFGDDPTLLTRFGRLMAARTGPVGRNSLPNDFGFFDMMGNVWEYTMPDEVAATASGNRPDLRRLPEVSMVRGGAFDLGPFNIQRRNYFSCAPLIRNNGHGFRVVLTGRAAPADPGPLLADLLARTSDPESRIPVRQRLVSNHAQPAALARRWAEAARLYRAAVDPHINPMAYRTELACCQLMAGDRDGYRRTCEEAWRNARPSSVMPLVNHLADISTLAPEGVVEPVGVASLGDLLASSPAVGRLGRSYRLTAAAVSDRLGRPEEAIRRTQDGMAFLPGPPHPLAAVLLAISHQRLGHVGEARYWLAIAGPPRPRLGPGINWSEVEYEIFYREALALIDPAARELPENVFAR